jgi:hypothetical protein
MKRVLIAVNFFLVIQCYYTPLAHACGDKFLVIGRGLRYERAYAAAHPASMVFYSLNQNETKNLQAALKKAGHKITTTTNEQQLLSTLNSGKYDLVLLNLDNASLLGTKILATSSKPFVLPVINKSKTGKIEVSASKEPCILKNEDKNKDAIKVIDHVMDDKIKGKPMKCDWSK